MDATGSLDEIAVFVHVVQAGSFTAAARQRGVPKSTLSRAVTRLEEAMRARLLRRSPRKIALTEAGRAFYDRAAPHVAGLLEASEALDRDDQPRGTIRLTAPPDVGDAFLGELLVRFAAQHPLLRVEVELSTQKHNLVEAGFDVAIRAAAPAYLTRRGTPSTPEELVRHDCVLFRPVNGRSEWVLQSGEGEERHVTVTGRIAGSDFAFLRSTLRAGAGIGLLPSFVVARDVAEGTLQRVLPAWSRGAGSLCIAYPAARHVPRKVIAFRDFVLESFAQAAPRGRT